MTWGHFGMQGTLNARQLCASLISKQHIVYSYHTNTVKMKNLLLHTDSGTEKEANIVRSQMLILAQHKV